jgi:putative DNA primase/helicase
VANEIQCIAPANAYPGVPVKVLRELLDTIKPVDLVSMIREQTMGEQSGAVPQKHFIVCIVQHIIDCAKAENLNLCQRQEFVYAYDGTKWTQIEKETLRNVLALAAEKMGYTPIEANYYEFKDKLLKQFMSAAHLPEPVIDEETVLVNFQNGTLEIKPQLRTLREHRPADFLTYELPFEYDEHATCPLFTKYLNEVQLYVVKPKWTV